MTDQPPGPDRTVERVNGVVTTALDTLGFLLLAGAIGWALFVLAGLAAGLGGAGVIVLALSAVAQHRPARARPKMATPARVPGPSDPGPLHIAGGE